jgi:DNA-binding NarL/FixJ family response regulator
MPPCRITFIQGGSPTHAALQASLARDRRIEILENAATDSQGLQFLETSQPDVVIVGIDPPELDGIEMTRQIKALETCDLKVLILTQQDEAETVLKAFVAGANSYCLKNKPLTAFVDIIQATAQGQAWIDPAIAPIVLTHLRQSYEPIDKPSDTVGPASQPDSSDVTFPLSPLSNRELQVLQLIVGGYDNATIAVRLQIGIGTVKTHVRHILRKLSACDRTQAAVRALRLGLVR